MSPHIPPHTRFNGTITTNSLKMFKSCILFLTIAVIMMLALDTDAQNTKLVSPTHYAAGATTFWFEVTFGDLDEFGPKMSIIMNTFPEDIDVITTEGAAELVVNEEYKDLLKLEVTGNGYEITNPTGTTLDFSSKKQFLGLRFSFAAKAGGAALKLPYKGQWTNGFLNFWGASTVQTSTAHFEMNEASCLITDGDGDLEDTCKETNTMKICDLYGNRCQCDPEVDEFACLQNEGNGRSFAMGFNPIGEVMMAFGVMLALVVGM